MENTMRFGIEANGVKNITVLDWKDILSGNHTELVEAKRMLPYLQNTTSDEALYEEDILSLKAKDISEEDMFWGSGAGQKMKERGMDEFLLYFHGKDHEPLTAILYGVKDGSPVTESIYYDSELEEGAKDEIWKETGVDMLFIRYFIRKGAILVGNDWEQAEILKDFK